MKRDLSDLNSTLCFSLCCKTLDQPTHARTHTFILVVTLFSASFLLSPFPFHHLNIIKYKRFGPAGTVSLRFGSSFIGLMLDIEPRTTLPDYIVFWVTCRTKPGHTFRIAASPLLQRKFQEVTIKELGRCLKVVNVTPAPLLGSCRRVQVTSVW